MHGTFRSEQADEAPYWPESPSVPPSWNPHAATAAQPYERSEYGARRVNWPLIGFILCCHALLLTMLVMLDVIPVAKPRTEPLVVNLVELQNAPPPEKQVEEAPPVEKAIPQIVAPVQIIQTPAPAPQLAAVNIAPPPPPPVVAPPSPPAPISVSDLGAKMVAIVPPRYPMESRRGKEQGTVVLTVVLNTDGSVADVHIAQSSGHRRLDRAALEAVRKWRWSPTIRGGEPVMVQGMVDIPFILKA